MSKICSSLESLCLDYCSNFTESTFLNLLKYATNLKSLCMRHCYQITLNNLAHPNLVELDISASISVGRDGVMEVIIPSLRKLLANICVGISDDFIQQFIKNCPQLEWMELSQTEITSINLQNLSRLVALKMNDCTNLLSLQLPQSIKELDLHGCKKVLDDSIAGIFGKEIPCINFEKLDLFGCVNVSEQTTKLIISKCRSFKVLNFGMCSVAQNTLKMLPKLFPLEELYLSRSSITEATRVMNKMSITNLQVLALSGLKGPPVDLQCIPSLRVLLLDGYVPSLNGFLRISTILTALQVFFDTYFSNSAGIGLLEMPN
jgi:hypothetical protein